jgi:two-component system, response regulator YesN
MTSLLIADDTLLIRTTIARVVVRDHLDFYPVVEARDGAEAVELARRIQPDIVLIDIKMPGLDGLQASAIIRAELPRTKIIILTAYDEFSYVQQALKIGAIDYLLKPIRPVTLTAILGRFHDQICAERRQLHQFAHTREYGAAAAPLAAVSSDRRAHDRTTDKTAIRDMLERIRSGDTSAAANILEGIVDRWAICYRDRPDILRNVLSETMALVAGAAIGAGAPEDDTLDLAHEQVLVLLATDDIAEMHGWALQSLAELVATAPAPVPGTDEVVQQALDYISHNQHRADITLAEVAEAVSLSPSHLTHVLKEKAGVSYKQFLTASRIETAKKLLHTTNLTIDSVAEQVGYQNTTNFYRLFQRETGLTPAGYRRSAP